MDVVSFYWDFILVEVEAFVGYELLHDCEKVAGFE